MDWIIRLTDLALQQEILDLEREYEYLEECEGDIEERILTELYERGCYLEDELKAREKRSA